MTRTLVGTPDPEPKGQPLVIRSNTIGPTTWVLAPIATTAPITVNGSTTWWLLR